MLKLPVYHSVISCDALVPAIYDLYEIEILIPTLILFVSTLGACWLSAKIYQVGVLLYGQKLSPKLLYKAIKAQ